MSSINGKITAGYAWNFGPGKKDDASRIKAIREAADMQGDGGSVAPQDGGSLQTLICPTDFPSHVSNYLPSNGVVTMEEKGGCKIYVPDVTPVTGTEGTSSSIEEVD